MTTGDDAAVLDLTHRWAAAEQANDHGTLAPLLAEGFVGVGAAGFVLDREQWLGRFAMGLDNRSVTVRDPRVLAHRGAAVVIGILEQQTFFADTDASGRFRISLVGVATDGGWRVASVHIGPLQEPGPPRS